MCSTVATSATPSVYLACSFRASFGRLGSCCPHLALHGAGFGSLVGSVWCFGGGGSCSLVCAGLNQQNQHHELRNCGFCVFAVGDGEDWSHGCYALCGNLAGQRFKLACHVGGPCGHDEGLLGGVCLAQSVSPSCLSCVQVEKLKLIFKEPRECQLQTLPAPVNTLATT